MIHEIDIHEEIGFLLSEISSYSKEAAVERLGTDAFDGRPVYATMTAVAAGEIDTYRNLEPKSMLAETKSNIEAPWNKKARDGLRTRPASLQKSYEMKPETPVS